MGDPKYRRSTGGKNWRHKHWWPAMVVKGVAALNSGKKYEVTPKGWRKIEQEKR